MSTTVRDIPVAILVEPDFVPTELALVKDVFRIANRLSENLTFTTHVWTSCGEELVEGLGGLLVRATHIPDKAAIEHFIVLGGPGASRHSARLRACVRRFESKGCEVLLLSDAASEWKRLNPRAQDVTTHWENNQSLSATYSTSGITLPLYSRSNRIATGAGMMATADVLLNTVIAPLSTGLANAISQVLLMHAIRTPDTHQPRSENDSLHLQQARLESVIQMMEKNMEVPLSITDLAAHSGFSIRRLERRFLKATGYTPKKFYLLLRLKHGRTLVEQTAYSLAEIAIRTGFSSGASFSRAFARHYEITPARLRALNTRTARLTNTASL